MRHRERWAEHLELARPLEELIPEAKNAEAFKRHQLIEREINRLIPVVSINLRSVIATFKIRINIAVA